MFQRILVPLDGSKTAEKILPFVAAEARLHGATVVLLRAVAPLRQSLIMVPSVMENVYSQIEDIAQDYLESVAEKLRGEGLEIETITKKGPPAQCILDTAVEMGCDLTIISTHGETDSPRWRFGGVANKVIKAHSDIPMLVIPTQGER
jgi:nucleotide-binding universal stress UspA family protein